MDGKAYSAFQNNTYIVRVKHDLGYSWTVVFPRDYRSKDSTREDLIATALFGAGVAYAKRKTAITVDGA